MSANADKKDAACERQLDELETSLRRHENDRSMLGEVGLAMRNLLAGNGDSEERIRELLEKQHRDGQLRPETYELVERMLDKVISEMPSATEAKPVASRELEGEVPELDLRLEATMPDPAVTTPHVPPAEQLSADAGPSPTQGMPEEKAATGNTVETEQPYVDTEVIDPNADTSAPDPSLNQLQVGSVLRDRFLLKELVSEGSMGSVYKALDRRMAETGEENPFVAIKVLTSRLSRNSDALRALQQEAAKGRCLSHPNIVRFIDLDREGDEFFLVMEWLEGRSLAKILDSAKTRAIDLKTAIDIVRQVGRALTYAHQLGVVHADIKPGNIIVTPDGHVKLIDFGVARVRQKENEGKFRFDPNVMRAGSPAYSSMQVLTGDDPVPADDVFSLACLLYRLVAGYRVFGPRNAADAAQEGMEPQRPEGLNGAQWQALRKALAYSRVTRFESPQAFLEAFGGGADSPKTTNSDPKPQKPTPEVTPEPPLTAAKDVPMDIGHDEATHVSLDGPMRAERDPIMFDAEVASKRSPWRLAVIGTILVASAFVVVETGVIDDIDSIDDLGAFVDGILPVEPVAEQSLQPTPPGSSDDAVQSLEALPETDVAEVVADDAADNVTEELVINVDDGTVDQQNVATVARGAGSPQAADPAAATESQLEEAPLPVEAVASLPPAIDFSTMPAPGLLLELKKEGDLITPVAQVALREESGELIIDMVRDGDLAEEYAVNITEVAPAGASAAIDVGAYSIANDAVLTFGIGQPRARTTLTMPSNTVRAEDRHVLLSVRTDDEELTEVARISLTLEDDDMRAFEAALPPNTVGFLKNELYVQEFDPAVQIDIVRFRPDDNVLEIPYILMDGTATEGEDYFSPGLPVIYFAPGQREARILIPLGQDGRRESSENFILELDTFEVPEETNISTRITVMIRDDDS